MQTRYPPEVIQNIIDNIKVKDYIENYINLKKHGDDYFSICPFHDETDSSFSVSPEKNIWYCFGCGKGSSIIDFVMLYHRLSFTKAVEHLIRYTNLDINSIPKESEIVNFLRRLHTVQIRKVEDFKHEILPLDVMAKYKNSPIKEWLSEGIRQKELDLFDVRYDTRSNRIVFPIFDMDGNIINVKGRTLCDDFKSLGIKKYIYYYPLGKLDFLYGYHQNRQYINESKELILFEGSKSVKKIMGWGINNVCSFETNRISDDQIPIILSLKKDIIIALDKGIKYEAVLKEAHKLSRFTNVFIIWDNKNLLTDKDSPCDKGLVIWQQLYSNKIKI